MQESEINYLINILKSLGINDNSYFTYINQTGRIRVIDVPIDSNIWGCFIQEKEGVITDIKFLVPPLTEERSILINIHELAHGYEIFPYLGTTYQEDKNKSEKYAKDIEQQYLERKKQS